MKRATSGLGMLVIAVLLVRVPLECGLTVVHCPGEGYQHEEP